MFRALRAALALSIVSLGSGVAHAEDGELDLAFGDRGVLSTDAGFQENRTSMVLQGDGRVLVGVDSDQFTVLRQLADGSLDTTFGGDGIVQTVVNPGFEGSLIEIALQPDGRVVAAGHSGSSAVVKAALVRHLSDGTLDPDFGTGGIVLTELPGVSVRTSAVALQPDGGIVVVGTLGFSVDFVVLRYLSDGTLDTGFDGDGVRTFDLAEVEAASDVVVQADGKILVVVRYESDDLLQPSTRVVRLDSDGSLDATYGTGGIAEVPFVDARGARLLAGGGLLLAGGFMTPTVPALAQLTDDGVLDSSLGGGGLVATQGLGHGLYRDVLVDTEGHLVAAGEHGFPFLDRDFLVARYEANGVLDPTFARCGATITSVGTGVGGSGAVFGDGDDVLWSIAQQSDGKLLASGSTKDETTSYAALARYGTAALPACLSDTPARSRVTYKTSRRKLVWKWRGLTSAAAFGDPLDVATDFRVCVVSQGHPVIQGTVEAAGHLPSFLAAAWRATRTGFKFTQPGGAVDDIWTLVLSAPVGGESSIKLRMFTWQLFPHWAYPVTPFLTPLTVRLVRNDDHSCFESSFSAPIKNDAGAFRAVSD